MLAIPFFHTHPKLFAIKNKVFINKKALTNSKSGLSTASAKRY
jgi:hypothetical protein